MLQMPQVPNFAISIYSDNNGSYYPMGANLSYRDPMVIFVGKQMANIWIGRN